MSKKNGINPKPIKGTTAFDPRGNIFPHHRLPPSGPVLPGGEILQIGFDQMIFTADKADSYQIPNTQANPFDNKIPRDVSGNATFPFTGTPMGVTLKSVKKGNIVVAWFSFGVFFEGATVTLATMALAVDDGAGNNPLPIPFSIQSFTADSAMFVTGSILGFFVNPALQTQDIRVFPLAAKVDPLVEFIFPASNQVALIAAEIETP